uniref:Reverse transcriptase zinc-binding domain-containing protein n=1 Tax=Salix viminalis TaxID=40686 RepID=A0A6N2M5M2_SALVM
MQKRLAGWKVNNLSLAGKITLCKVVLATIPLYPMQAAVIPKHTCKEIEKICRRFIWGQTEGRDKIHLVNWKIICKPKEEGGLGLRKMDMMNKAFIMKLAWGMMQEKSLWVKFLEDKYMNTSRGEGRPVASASDSVLWKAICREWDTVRQNVSWQLGNGSHISFWKDKWVGDYGPLINLLNPEATVNTLHYTVADMVDSGGNWKWELFAHFLPIHTVMSIAGHIPPMQDTRADSVAWDHSSNGRLSVRTAYRVQEEGGEMDRDPLWRTIWKWKGLERIGVFLWTVGHNAIMTNEARWRRKMTDNKYCGRCVNEVESVIHALRDCPKARKIWEVFVRAEERGIFFSQNWYAWLVSNLAPRKERSRYGDWHLVFGITLWYIWKERCNTTFGGGQALRPTTSTSRTSSIDEQENQLHKHLSVLLARVCFSRSHLSSSH